MNCAVLIPAYKPNQELIKLVKNLSNSVIEQIIVVNDGSGNEFTNIFEEVKKIPRVTLLQHAVNMGKGAALKTGLNFCHLNFPKCAGVVTADADGQHVLTDILKVCQALTTLQNSLILGARQFQGKVPLRSRFGNTLTRYIFFLLVGQRLTDTQSGLRGIPRDFIPVLLLIESNRYEFELDMLIQAKLNGTRIKEVPIQTVYIENNKSSHFNPIIDSMKIYWVFLRFVSSSLTSAAADYVIFLSVFYKSHDILLSTAIARSISIFINYLLVKDFVFRTNRRWSTLPKFIILAIVLAFSSYILIEYFYSYLGFNIVVAKILAEVLLYFGNFAVQRELIFKK